MKPLKPTCSSWQQWAIGSTSLLAWAVVLTPPAAALDYQFLFNQTPGDLLGTFLPDGNVVYQWNLVDGRTRIFGEYDVQGVIAGMQDNLSNQTPARIEVIRADHDPFSVGMYTFSRGSGFDVIDGEITRAFWIGILDSPTYVRRLIFTPSVFTPPWVVLDEGSSLFSYDDEGNRFIDCACTVTIPFPQPGSAGVFTAMNASPSSEPVPGPLPILGAFTALHASRRLRRRLHHPPTTLRLAQRSTGTVPSPSRETPTIHTISTDT